MPNTAAARIAAIKITPSLTSVVSPLVRFTPTSGSIRPVNRARKPAAEVPRIRVSTATRIRGAYRMMREDGVEDHRARELRRGAADTALAHQVRYARAVADLVEPQAPKQERRYSLGQKGQHETQRRERERSGYLGDVNDKRIEYLIHAQGILRFKPASGKR
jgi:hypothetical protein